MSQPLVTMLKSLKTWIREPLLHFLLAGGLLFAAYGWLDRGGDTPREVRINAAEVNWLRETWTRQWQRPPSEEELRGLVSDYLKETLLAREAMEMGLDENDTIVRRRLAQKMEFLVQDTARLAEPGEAALRRFYADRSAQYQPPARMSFTQIFFRTEDDARRALQALRTRNPAELGDPSMLERDYSLADEHAVTSVFGPEFADKLFTLSPGPWQGPLASGYGFHLVHVIERQTGQTRPFEEVRAQVLDAWHREQQARASAQFLDGLLKKYDVVVEDSVKPLLGPLSKGMR